MIYKKEANFPYPVLTPGTNSYIGSSFELTIGLRDDGDRYIFQVDYELESEFLKKLLREDRAEIIFVVQSRDNKFCKLEGKEVEIKKSRISLNKKTSVQLLIKAKDRINFQENNELSHFYDEFKGEIEVEKNSVLAFSNVCILKSMKDPLKLFEKRVDSKQKSDIAFKMGSETIIICYKKAEYQFPGMRGKDKLNNAYIYMGLQRALMRFINKYAVEEEEAVYIETMDEPDNALDLKLYMLMKSKSVYELNEDNLDEVIYRITDRIIEKYYTAVKELSSDGN